MSDQQDNMIGRKIFFLNPHSVLIQEQLIEVVSQAEYEVYIVRDPVKVKKLMVKYPNSILFINIDEKVRDVDWPTYIQEFMTDPETKNVRIGVLSFNDDPDLAKRYLMDLSVPCGFVRLRQGLKESARILVQVLEANEARGRRKHVRVSIPENMNVTFNIKNHHTYWSGHILDISIAGIACYFDQSTPISSGYKIDDMQLNLKGVIVRVSGVVVGMREIPEGKLYVVLFTSQPSTETRRKIQYFVYQLLQEQMDHVISSL